MFLYYICKQLKSNIMNTIIDIMCADVVEMANKMYDVKVKNCTYIPPMHNGYEQTNPMVVFNVEYNDMFDSFADYFDEYAKIAYKINGIELTYMFD